MFYLNLKLNISIIALLILFYNYMFHLFNIIVFIEYNNFVFNFFLYEWQLICFKYNICKRFFLFLKDFQNISKTFFNILQNFQF